MTPGKWTHKNFRDVYFLVTQVMPTYTLKGYWIRKDFGCGELVLNSDEIKVKWKDRNDWSEI